MNLERMLTTLKSKGLHRYAQELEEISAQLHREEPLTKRRVLPSERMHEKPRTKPTIKKEPFAEKGEEIIELSPQTERLVRWKMPGVGEGEKFTVEDWVDAVKSGVLTSEIIRKELGQASGEKKKTLSDLLSLARGKEKIKKEASRFLSRISSAIAKDGMDDIAEKIEGISRRLSAAEMHPRLFSIESIYQKSSDLLDFMDNLEEFQKILENIVEVIKDFEKEYRNKSRDYIKNDITKEEVDKILMVVRSADSKINRYVKELEKKIKM